MFLMCKFGELRGKQLYQQYNAQTFNTILTIQHYLPYTHVSRFRIFWERLKNMYRKSCNVNVFSFYSVFYQPTIFPIACLTRTSVTIDVACLCPFWSVKTFHRTFIQNSRFPGYKEWYIHKYLCMTSMCTWYFSDILGLHSTRTYWLFRWNGRPF